MPTTLEPYERKRDFDRTPEPRPQQTGARENALRFVIYKHAARRLHYDFRFELDGVLKSWAVPKGPMLNPAQKHLAVHVEDHPLEYGEFEGQIPEGEYGAGDVVIWDRGKYAPLLDGKPVTGRNQAEALMRSQIESGMVKVFLMGEKLHGGWAFVRLRDSEKDWLLIKENDEFADRQNEIDEDDDSSVVSGRDLQRQAPASKTDGREIRAPKVIRSRTKLDLSEIPGAKRAPMPNTAIRPMLATLTDKPFVNDDWVFEPKLDGMRILAHVYGKGESNRSKPSIILYSRTGQDTTSRFPKLVEKLGSFSDVEMLLDGEIVAPDEKGAPSFQRLQPRINLTDSSQIQRADKEIPVYYLIFDVLHLDGYDLKNVPLEKRRAILESLIPASGPISLIAQSQSDGEAAYAAAITHGFEGVVAKRRDSRYETRRSHRWLKLKAVSSDEFIIGGYTHGTGRRAETFGALLMGQYDSQNRLVYSGHVGTGFDADTLHMLMERLKPLAVKKCPFSAVPPANAPAVWVEPELTAEIKFAIRTDDGILRAPVFLRLREDKPAGEVHPAEVVSAAQIVDNEKPVKKQSTSETTDGSVESILAQLNDRREELELSVDGQSIPVTNLDKTLWPETAGHRALTKRDLLKYLTECSPHLLHHMRDRPLTLTRYPNGIEGKFFYQRHWPHKLPPFVYPVVIYTEDGGGDRTFILCNNLPTLLWLGQIADIELHTWFSRINPEPDGKGLPREFSGSNETVDKSLLSYPDYMVFDLDPYLYSGKEKKGTEPELHKAGFEKTCEVALYVKEVVDLLGLTPFIKTSGKTGLHIYVPLRREQTFEVVRSACETIGRHLMKSHPKDITMDWSTAKRTGKVFFDHNMNARSKTIASVYSPRAGANAGVSMPLRWEEVGKVYPSELNILTAPERLREVGDLWEAMFDAKRGLKELFKEKGNN